jgi:hypothetical protein
MIRLFIKSLLWLGFICITLTVRGQKPDKGLHRMEAKAVRRSVAVPALFDNWKHMAAVSIDSIRINPEQKILNYYLSSSVTQIPARQQWIESVKTGISNQLGRKFRGYTVQLWGRGRMLDAYIPNLYRDSLSRYDAGRLSTGYSGRPLVTRMDKPTFENGLSGRHIALWPSHGCYYNYELDRWQWQRARLWQTVEDIFPWSFTAAYLVPMLENAGATVLLPRERDVQVHEVIVDNDHSTGKSMLIKTDGMSHWETGKEPGFLYSDTITGKQNPFTCGTSLSLSCIPQDTASLLYIPDIPETGEYAVYVSWAKSEACNNQVGYEVIYDGGRARFDVNQCMGAGTWIYLGTFQFRAGLDSTKGAVRHHGGNTGGMITADAVRFGGGMGNVACNKTLSGKPRWMEGSRYYLQYAGMPDSLVYDLSNVKNDYTDDYMSRPEWVNYLIGNARPQYTNKYRNGLNIPVDLALAFHTDAGVTSGDSVVGTLGIFSTTRNEGVFPGGQSKLASRDLADIIETQVLEDVQRQADPQWMGRGLWDREYSEAWRPVVPVMLLELLSHQNLADMKFGLDPRFRFIVSRAIYKGILRFLAAEQGREVVVEPLHPDHLYIEGQGERKIRLGWQPVNDPLEATAKPDGYKVYMKTEDSGFDQGFYTTDTSVTIDLPKWNTIYSFRVTAVNSGGESLPGETLSVSLKSNDNKPVLVVNAFDRICGPSFFDKGDMAGIAWWDDEGVPDGKELLETGVQYDFSRSSLWLNDDSQGWGASSADLEGIQNTGNTFANALIHGKALRDAGYSFVSVSNEVFESPAFDVNRYAAVDIIFGEERGTPSLTDPQQKEFRLFTAGMIRSISRYTRQGGNLLISGAYVGTDMVENHDSLAIRFASEVLHYAWRTHHATRVGDIEATAQGRSVFPARLQFNTHSGSDLYSVESPDAIEPSGMGAGCIYRYTSGGCSAATAYKGSAHVVVLGFPFESVSTEQMRLDLISAVMKFFNNGKTP